MTIPEKSLKVLVVDDDIFIKNLISELICKLGYKCNTVTNVNDALIAIDDFTPNLVITELYLGKGPSGLNLINKIALNYPEINVIVLTNHRSPLLVDTNFKEFPTKINYVLKSEISSSNTIENLLHNVLNKKSVGNGKLNSKNEGIFISKTQAELLRLIVQGLSNQAIAEKRGTTLRAVEALINRTYEALNLHESESKNLRVEAVKMWKSSLINVK
jgi:DNA-binding NarL/FixJ family response regulator